MIDSDGVIECPMVRTRYNYDRNAVSRGTSLRCEEKSLAQQSFKEQSDINTIVRQFGLTGELPQNVQVPVSGDFSEVGDFQSAMAIVRKAEEAFMQLPADVRARFHNDPQELQVFVENKDNIDEARKLGIAVPAAKPPVPPEPMLVRLAPDSAPVSGDKPGKTS